LERGDKIFEAFAATIIAKALGMEALGRTIRDRVGGASFAGNGYKLYYDVKPPAHIIRSWRDATEVPDRDRPDILVHNENHHRLSLLDAKFKDYEGGSDLTSDVQEMQAYQHSYGIRRSAILTPYGKPRSFAGGGYLINVVPLPTVPHDRLGALLAHV